MFFVNTTHTQLVFQYLQGGDLFDKLNTNRYNEKQSKYHMRKIALALKYLHDRFIVHRDLNLKIYY